VQSPLSPKNDTTVIECVIPHLLTAKEVQRVLGVSLALVYRMAERGQLPCVRWECPGEGEKRPRTMIRFELEQVQRFIEQHRQYGGYPS
jgi:transposase